MKKNAQKFSAYATLAYGLFLSFLLISVNSCGKSSDSGDDSDGGAVPLQTAPPPIQNQNVVIPTNPGCSTGTVLTHRNFGAAFFASYCTGCHAKVLTEEARFGAPMGLDFDSYSGISLEVVAIGRVAGDPTTATMPPSGNVTADERRQLAEWVGCGAPE